MLKRLIESFLMLAFVASANHPIMKTGQKVEEISFDMFDTNNSQTFAWATTGSAVAILTKVKVLPMAAHLNG